MKKTLFLVLNNIRSMENVGSIFRTADAAGVAKIYLCGITPKPPRKEIDKAALGAVDFVDWEYCENILDLIKELKERKISVVALEQDPRSIQYSKFKNQYSDKVALIIGNEVEGISKEVLDQTDTIIEIPMYGKKNSLNVAVATGIALFELIKD
jgi:tRNA G18 (ribose-2'-O)-methylase SpoU